jgi:broad specificity phosphatase PhoE
MAAWQKTVLMACSMWLALTAQASAAGLDDEALVKALRAGGYTIYFRHTQTDWSKDDHIAKAGDWKSCDPNKIRQLSDTGRETAKAIGRAIRALKLPIRRVLSSEYCRATETVRLMQIGTVEPTTDIMNLRAADYVGGRDAAVKRLQQVIAAPVAPGGNVVIGAHGNLIKAASGVYPGEGGAAIFQSDAKGEHGFRYVASLEPGDWTRLAERFGVAD